MMLAAEPPAVVATVVVDKSPEMVVVRRETHSEVLVSRDTPLPLIKAGRTEDAILRHAIFLTTTLSVVRPAAGDGEEKLRWSYEPYLQSRLCFTSMTGQFSCAAADVEEMTEKAAGEAPLEAADEDELGANPTAEAARLAVETALRTRADGLFDGDRRLKLDPMLKAVGVSIRRPAVAANPAAR